MSSRLGRGGDHSFVAGPEEPGVGALDVGSHTVGLAIARPGPGGSPEFLADDTRFTRLGEGLSGSGRLTSAAIERTIRAVGDLLEANSGHEVMGYQAAITSPGRMAANPGDLIDALRAISVRASVVTGAQEARYTWEGVRTGGLLSPSPIVLDIGGGSTEIAWEGPEGQVEGISLPIGVVSLTETFWKRGPPSAAQRRAAESQILDLLGGSGVPPHLPGPLVGVAGTPRSLAWLTGQDLADGPAALEVGDIISWAERLLGMTQETVLGLDTRLTGREHILPAGALILAQVAQFFGKTRVLASALGLRHGLAWRLVTGAPGD